MKFDYNLPNISTLVPDNELRILNGRFLVTKYVICSIIRPSKRPCLTLN